MQYLISLLNNIRSNSSEMQQRGAVSVAENTLDDDTHLHNSALWKAAAQQTAFDIIRF